MGVIDNSKNPLIGSWYCKDMPTAIYNFKDNGIGSYTFLGVDLPFEYDDNGKSVTILYQSNTVASEYKYRIESDKLLIEDSFGSTVVYIKKQ